MIDMENVIPVVCVVGPTASGKTSLSIKLAKLFNGEIVSADSMQIYKGMSIATAKPSVDEQDGVLHHLIDFVDIDNPFSVAQYCEIAHATIKDIYKRGKLPILVGGTGLYIDSLLNNITFSDADRDEELRKDLYSQYSAHGVEYLLDKLATFDEESAHRLSVEKNVKRIIRAIEVFQLTGITITEHNKKSMLLNSPYKVVKIGLNSVDRQYLYDRINKRVDIMVENGLVEEAGLYLSKNVSSTSSMAIGHKELLPYFKGEADISTCIDNLKMQTRRYAKRQLTWFKRDLNTNWLSIDMLREDELLSKSEEIIKKVLFDE